jgi:hypothetical protein
MLSNVFKTKRPEKNSSLFAIAGDGGIGHELLSFLFRYAHKNLSTLDPASPSQSDMAPAFDSSHEQSSLLVHHPTLYRKSLAQS